MKKHPDATPGVRPRGRPPKDAAEKLDANLNFSCPTWMVAGLEEYRRTHGLRSVAEAARAIIGGTIKEPKG